jgi:uncharacterized membrane protein
MAILILIGLGLAAIGYALVEQRAYRRGSKRTLALLRVPRFVGGLIAVAVAAAMALLLAYAIYQLGH